MTQRQRSAIAALAGGLVLGLAFDGCASLPPGASTRGPAGPSVPLDCAVTSKELTGPDRAFHEMEAGCLESYAERVTEALEASPEIASFDLRSGQIETFPPSSQWRRGGNPRHPEAPSAVIPVRFAEPLRQEPWVVTWFSRLEATRPKSGGPGLEISKENLGPMGMQIRLTALGGVEVFDVAIGWVAYETVASD